MIINIDNSLKTSGIYKITYDNGKVYIGQSINIKLRALEHNTKAQQVCDKALKKHEATIEILEEIEDLNQLDCAEAKWIKYYDACNKDKGYNILKNGDASNQKGINNPNAVFDENTLQEVITMLKERPDLSLIDIGKKFNVQQGTILNINQGHSYYNPELSYPIRPYQSKTCLKKDNIKDYFKSMEKLISLKEDLKYRWDLSIETDLVKLYNLPVKIIRDINLGRKFAEYGEYTYPIRKQNVRNYNNFNFNDILNILADLKYTSLTKTQIGEKYGISRTTVAKINLGQTYFIKGYNYPART